MHMLETAGPKRGTPAKLSALSPTPLLGWEQLKLKEEILYKQ